MGTSVVSDGPRLAAATTFGRHPHSEGVTFMIVLGVVLLIIGFLAHISILWTIGIVLVVIGAVLALVGSSGRKIGGRAHWF
jgi:uncharacterized membrane protein HdeD (DUF308 family)